MRKIALASFIIVACSAAYGQDSASGKKHGIWISDLTRFEPADAISCDGKPDTWIAVDYETDEGKGVMLYARSPCGFHRPGSDVPPLTLKLGVSGWYKIRLGIYYGGEPVNRMLFVKLSGDAAFTRVGRESFRKKKDGDYPEKDLGEFDIAEAFWKCADLTGQDLVIAAPKRGLVAEWGANLAYVRLVPMDEADLAEWQAEQPKPETKRLMASCDGGSIGHFGLWTPEDFLAEFQSLRDSDVEIVTYNVARGSSTIYPSKVADMLPRYGGHERGEGAYQCAARGLDPLAELIKAAHACGIKFFPRSRIVGPQLPAKHLRHEYGGKLMADHPEWMCTYPDGEPTRHLSFAFKGVRDYHISMMREWVEDYRADGVCLVFSRGWPFVYYEKPVRDAFQKEYGLDMQQVPVSDPRSQRVRARFLTGYLQEVRAMLDEVGRVQGRTIPTCCIVPVHCGPDNVPLEAYETLLAENMFSAFDIATWIREGLVDYLDVHLHMFGQHDGTEVVPKIREVTDLARGTKTKVYVDIYPRRMPPRQFRKIAMTYYKVGADGLSFWDTPGRMSRISEWAFVKRLGHEKDLPTWEKEGKGDDYYNFVPLRRLDGFLMGREFSRPTDG